MREETYKEHDDNKQDNRRGRDRNNILNEFWEYIQDRRGGGRSGNRNEEGSRMRNRIGYDTYNTHSRSNSKDDRKENLMKLLVMGAYSDEDYEHFDKKEAEYLVDEMYHIKNGKKYIGEKYDMQKAHEVCERYKEHLDDDVCVEDIYVAINAQYHDYCKLFESWFGSNFDNKVFESAITFWFKDVDFDGNKVWDYFHMEEY